MAYCSHHSRRGRQPFHAVDGAAAHEAKILAFNFSVKEFDQF